MTRGPSQAGAALPVEADEALLRPRLVPLSAEQQAEAVAMFSELLLAAARRSADGRRVPTDGAEGSPWRRGFSPGERARKGRAA